MPHPAGSIQCEPDVILQVEKWYLFNTMQCEDDLPPSQMLGTTNNSTSTKLREALCPLRVRTDRRELNTYSMKARSKLRTYEAHGSTKGKDMHGRRVSVWGLETPQG